MWQFFLYSASMNSASCSMLICSMYGCKSNIQWDWLGFESVLVEILRFVKRLPAHGINLLKLYLTSAGLSDYLHVHCNGFITDVDRNSAVRWKEIEIASMRTVEREGQFSWYSASLSLPLSFCATVECPAFVNDHALQMYRWNTEMMIKWLGHLNKTTAHFIAVDGVLCTTTIPSYWSHSVVHCNAARVNNNKKTLE